LEDNPRWLSVSCALIFVYGFSFLCLLCLWLSVLYICLVLWLTVTSVYLRVCSKGCAFIFVYACGPQFWAFSSVIFSFPRSFCLWIVSFLSPSSVIEIFSFATSCRSVTFTFARLFSWATYSLCVFICNRQISIPCLFLSVNWIFCVYHQCSRLTFCVFPCIVWTRLSVL